jgi:hypothetical protein
MGFVMGQHVELLADVRATNGTTQLDIANISQDYQDLMVFCSFKSDFTVSSAAAALPLYVSFVFLDSLGNSLATQDLAVQQTEYPITSASSGKQVLASDNRSTHSDSRGYIHIRNYSHSNGQESFTYETYSTLPEFASNTGDDSKPTFLGSGYQISGGNPLSTLRFFLPVGNGDFRSANDVANRVSVYGIKNRFI